MEVYLSCLAFSGGIPVSLDDATDASLTSNREELYDEGVRRFLAHPGSATDLAADAASTTLTEWGRSVDAVVYASDPVSTDDVMEVIQALGLEGIDAAAAGGLGCGNLAAALDVARGKLALGAESVLMITSDRADGPRLRANGMTVLSDAAASLIVTASPNASAIRVTALRTVIDTSVPGIESAIGRARATMRAVKEASAQMPALPPDAQFITGNYGQSSLDFLTMASGFDLDDLRGNATARIGHAFAADTIHALIGVVQNSAPRSSHYRMLVTSSRSWSFIDVEVLGAVSDRTVAAADSDAEVTA